MTEDATTSASNKHHKVIIIGAGIAGISAASHLSQNGITDFRILEARSRIGGRIISIELGEQKVVELGANWIHGVLGNPMFELAMQHGLVSVVNEPKSHKIIAATEDGKQVPFALLQEIYEAYFCFLRRCEEYFVCDYLPPEGINSVGEHIALEVELYLKNVADPKEKRLRQLVFENLLKRETCISGCHSMNEIDLLELGSYTELQGGNIVLPNGYSSILNPLVASLPANAIVLSCPVKTIRWKRRKSEEVAAAEAEEATASDDSDKTVIDAPTYRSQPPVEVFCEDGRVFSADHVICTVPLGVLKATHKTLFEPGLPTAKEESIDRLLYGIVDKIFLEYDRPFLNPNISEIMLIWDKTEADAELKDCWFKKIYSFTKVSDTLLQGWVSGREAEFMESLPTEVVGEKCTEILRKFLQDPFIPKPKKCVCTSWGKQPFSRGSYTAIAVGASQEDIENLAQPLYASPHQPKPSILFAGEHTHTNFYSTVHGAYLSARTAAKILYEPDTPQEVQVETEASDLSSWIQGIALD